MVKGFLKGTCILEYVTFLRDGHIKIGQMNFPALLCEKMV